MSTRQLPASFTQDIDILLYTLHFQRSSLFGSGLISVSISSTPSSWSERGLDMFAAVALFFPLPLGPLSLASVTRIATGPFFFPQPAASGELGTRSGAGATLTRLFRCFVKKKRRFPSQLRRFVRWAGSFGAAVGAKVDFALEAGSRLAVKPILTSFK